MSGSPRLSQAAARADTHYTMDAKSGNQEDFHEAMLAINETAKKFDPFHYVFRNMVEKEGGLQTAKRLMAEAGPHSGLLALHEEGRLDISVEAHMLRPEFQHLFSPAELAEARRRLKNLGYALE